MWFKKYPSVSHVCFRNPVLLLCQCADRLAGWAGQLKSNLRTLEKGRRTHLAHDLSTQRGWHAECSCATAFGFLDRLSSIRIVGTSPQHPPWVQGLSQSSLDAWVEVPAGCVATNVIIGRGAELASFESGRQERQWKDIQPSQPARASRKWKTYIAHHQRNPLALAGFS